MSKQQVYDEIEQSIINDGYIPNNIIQRQWVVIDTIKNQDDIDTFLKNKPYKYVWETILDEIKTTKNNNEKKFFNKNIIIKMTNDYTKSIQSYSKKLYNENTQKIRHCTNMIMKQHFKSTKAIEYLINECPMPIQLRKPNIWYITFKKYSIYHTISNLIKYNTCNIYTNNMPLNQIESLKELDKKIKEYNDDYNKLYQFFKQFITDNQNKLEAKGY